MDILNKNKETGRKRLQRINDLKELWGMESGKRILKELIKESGALTDPYSNSGQSMAHNIGKAKIGLELIQSLAYAGINISISDCMDITESDIKAYEKAALDAIKN